jgi:hypothetical protein
MKTNNTLLYMEVTKHLAIADTDMKQEVMYNDILPTTRRFRADFYCPNLGIIIEIQGGTWQSGRHSRAKGYADDCFKSRLAQLNGIKWFAYTYEQLANGDLIEDLKILKGGEL